MIDPNTSSTVLTAMETYAQNAPDEYKIPPGGTPAMESPEWQNGVIPLDTLPAAWWNWLLYTITEQEKRMVRYFNSIMTEFGNLLTAGGVASFDETVTNQLVLAIRAIARTPATTAVCGAIKAGTSYGTLAVDGTTGVATVNGMGTGQFNTIATDITGAVNELDGDIGQEINDRTSADNTLQGAINGKAPINHASSSTDPDTGLAVYGQASATDFGHVKLTDAYTDGASGASSGVAASAKALKDGLDSILVIQANVPTGAILPFGGASAPTGYLLCDGTAYDRTAFVNLFAVIGVSYGIGDGINTFNVPDLRECVPVGAGQSSRLSTVLAEHDVYTVGQFKDDQMQRVYGKLSGLRAGLGGSGSDAFKTYGSAENVSTWSGSWGTLDLDSTRITRSGWKTDPNDSNKQIKTGSDTTHGKQVGVNYIIKY